MPRPFSCRFLAIIGIESRELATGDQVPFIGGIDEAALETLLERFLHAMSRNRGFALPHPWCACAVCICAVLSGRPGRC